MKLYDNVILNITRVDNKETALKYNLMILSYNKSETKS